MPHLPVDLEAPGHVRGLAPELAVDEVADAPGHEPNARQGRPEIKDIGDVAPLADGEDRNRHEHPEEPAVKGHAALPDLERIPRIVLPVAQAVEQHIADAPSQDHPEHGVKDEIIDIARLPRRPRAGGAQARKPPPRRESDEVHDPVPMHLDWADFEGNGINGVVFEHERKCSRFALSWACLGSLRPGIR